MPRGKLRQQCKSQSAKVRVQAPGHNAKETSLEWLAHCGVPFNICAPARLRRLEAILMPYLHFLLQDFIQGHFYRFPALVMSLELLNMQGGVYTCTL